MAVTLEWIRDHYDTIIKDRYIDKAEAVKSVNDFFSGTITKEQLDAVQDAFNNHTLLPAYDTPPSSVTLEWVRDHYDANKNRYIDNDEKNKAVSDWLGDLITTEQMQAVSDACLANTLLPAYDTPTPPPNTETRTVSLTEGQHTIQVSFTGYDTLNATINVSSTGVTCVSVIGGACGGSSLPRVSTSGQTVTTYLKEGAAATNRCTWIAIKDTSKVAFISEMVLAYNNLANIGFTPSASEISQAVLMYAKLGTPASLWGC